MNLEQHTIESVYGQYHRSAWLLRGPAGQAHPLCVFLDGEHYLNDVNAAELLADAMANGTLPRMTCVFVSHVDAAARHVDFTRSDPYSRYIAEDVVNWAQQLVPGVTAKGNIICGLSLSGLASAYLLMMYPKVFSAALSQSGAFWWEFDDLANRARSIGINGRIWLSVGDEETETGVTHPPSNMVQNMCQLDGVANAVSLFRELGAQVQDPVFNGGHSPQAWQAELIDALAWLVDETKAAPTS